MDIMFTAEQRAASKANPIRILLELPMGQPEREYPHPVYLIGMRLSEAGVQTHIYFRHDGMGAGTHEIATVRDGKLCRDTD